MTIQQQLNNLAKLPNEVTGEVTITVEVKAASFKELEEKQDSILGLLNPPNGFKKTESRFYRKGFTIILFFVKIS